MQTQKITHSRFGSGRSSRLQATKSGRMCFVYEADRTGRESWRMPSEIERAKFCSPPTRLPEANRASETNYRLPPIQARRLVTQTLSSRLGSVTLKSPSWSPMLNTLTSNEAGLRDSKSFWKLSKTHTKSLGPREISARGWTCN